MMDYRDMTIWQLQQEEAKIQTELQKRGYGFWSNGNSCGYRFYIPPTVESSPK